MEPNFGWRWLGIFSVVGFWVASVLNAAPAMVLDFSQPLAPAIEGHYAGTITPADGSRGVNLEFSLTVADSYNGGEADDLIDHRRDVVGSFLLDDEGGPYTFQKSLFRTSSGLVDLRYNRGGANGQMGMRFVGQLGSDGSISGQVMTGGHGNFGTFNVTKISAATGLSARPKYVGLWTGETHWVNGDKPVSLSVDGASTQTPNPTDWDLDTTPGRMATFNYDPISIAFPSIFVDYLRHRLLLSDPDPNATLTMDCQILNVDQELECTYASSIKGSLGTIHYVKAPRGGRP